MGHADTLAADCINLPEELDDEIAALQLSAMGVKFDIMTEAQEAYMKSWQEGHDA
jgi:adenosylhomocysteinase